MLFTPSVIEDIVTVEARLGSQEAVGPCSPEVMVVRPPGWSSC